MSRHYLILSLKVLVHSPVVLLFTIVSLCLRNISDKMQISFCFFTFKYLIELIPIRFRSSCIKCYFSVNCLREANYRADEFSCKVLFY